jgi:hypothetical protein
MHDKTQLEVANSIVCVTGIFESSNQSKTSKLFQDNGYILEKIEDQQFHKNYWYPEFRDIFFRKSNKEVATIILNKQINKRVVFLRKNREKEIVGRINAEIDYVQVFLFPNDLHFFNISFNTSGLGLKEISDITNFSRNFDSELEGEIETKWVKWVEKEILNGIKIYSNWNEDPISVDEYSGSKFKLYTVVDLKYAPEINQQLIDELLYDIGCVAPLNSANGKTALTPSNEYYQELLSDKISAFNNFAILPLFDSFTTVGNNILSNDWQKVTYKMTYFRIYLFNLFIKYNLYRYNHEMRIDSVKTRSKFESFLNNYNLSVVSYNFLPNLIFEKHRKSMRIEEELTKFEDRINKISQAIQEEQQSRMNMLIGLVGLITSIGSVEPAIEILENVRNKIDWSVTSFYISTGIIALILSIPILAFLFPEKKKQLIRKWQKS